MANDIVQPKSGLIYSDEVLLYRNNRNQILQAKNAETGEKVALKRTINSGNGVTEASKLGNEWEILKNLDHPYIIKVLALIPTGNELTLVSDWFDGESLKSRIRKQGKLSLDTFFEIALKTANVLKYVHNAGVIHKDINPANILVSATNEVRLIDFGISSEILSEEEGFQSPDLIEGTLVYISPEQSGRTSFNVTTSSDIYSLGITFYELLTGKPPFESTDPLEIIHFHLSRKPAPLQAVAGIPAGLSKLVLKMLEKSPDDRYQSVNGILADLIYLSDCYAKNRDTTDFLPAQNDNKERYRQTQKLYGRDAEVTELVSCYRELDNTGSLLVLVAGYSGVGKSALVKQIHQPILEQRGTFISGKYDQFKQKIPYYAFIEAFNDHIKSILAESDEKVSYWKNKLTTVLGDNASLITEVIPYLERLVGKQPAAPKFQPAEQEYRFRMVLIDFMYAFTEPGRPIVIFLDDLQWADLPSLNLVERLLVTPGYGNILLLGAYRDNEVDEMHPLNVTVRQIESNNIKVKTVSLKPLNLENTTNIVADSFGMKPAQAQSLGNLTQKKTNGNPFFINRFLKSIYDDGYVYFNDINGWTWDQNEIDNLQYTDNVIDLMTREIAVLPDSTREILKIAAVLGSTFNLANMSFVSGHTRGEIFAHLGPALRAGYILPMDKNYRTLTLNQEGMGADWQKESEKVSSAFRFLHDRVQQAAYAMLSEKERDSIHLLAGRKILAHTPEERLSEIIFEIIGHYSQSYLLITDYEEKIQVANLLFFAGRKAKDSTSYDLAVKYLSLALKLTGAAWDTHYQLLFDVHLELGEAEYLNSSHEKAEAYFNEILKYAKTDYEKLKIYYVQSSLYLKLSDVRRSLATGRLAMKLFKIHFPENELAIKLATGKEIFKYLFLFSTKYKNPETLYNLKECTDKEIIMINQFLIDMATSAYMVNQELMMLIILKIIENYIRYGFTDASGWGFSGFSVVVTSALGLTERGFKLWDITEKLHGRTESQLIKWKLYYTVQCFGTQWRRPLGQDVENLLDNIKGCIMNGDPIFTGYAISLYIWKKSAIGFQIHKYLEQMQEKLDYLTRNRNTSGLDFSETRVQVMKAYAGLTNSLGSLDDDKYSATTVFNGIKESNNNTAIAYFYCARISLLCFFGRYRELVDWAQEGEKYKAYFLGNFMMSEWEFFTGIAIIEVLPLCNKEDKKKLLKTFSNSVRWMKIWAKDCPENFGGMLKLLYAEQEAAANNYEKALKLAEEAIDLFHTNGFVHLEALSNQRVGHWSLKRGYSQIAEKYIRNANYLYRSWGANALCKHLHETYPQYFEQKAGNAEIEEINSGSGTTASVTLDLATILKASQSIAGQIKLEDLLQSLMYIVIENVGATRGYLLLENERQLFIVAEGNAGPEGTKMLRSIPFTASNLTPKSLILYCRRVEEAVVVANAMKDPQYGSDPYVRENKILSMMCLPLADKGELVGLLYLENRLLDGVFTGSKLDLLNLLSGQIAISIQNAMLVENLEEKVKERTHEIQMQQIKIEMEMQKSDALLLNILPQKTADDLKNLGYTKAVHYDNAHVMFCDLVGFTKRAESMSPQEIVNEIHEFFSGIDDIMLKYNIEKIKTIGDAYMCAAGLTELQDETAAIRIVKAAQDILSLLQQFNEKTSATEKPAINLRIGIHTGPVVAGVVGKSKFAYDIWGDTVNTASRMESAGQPGKINISAQTYEQIKDSFKCSFRGKLEVKSKGLIEMYFVDGD